MCWCVDFGREESRTMTAEWMVVPSPKRRPGGREGAGEGDAKL